MIVKEILEKLDEFSNEERAFWVRRLIDKASPRMSVALKSFQESWTIMGRHDTSKSLDENFSIFRREQNILIRICVEQETRYVAREHPEGPDKQFITLDTDIEGDYTVPLQEKIE